MKIVVVGGQARNIGKTSVMAGLIRRLRGLDWTAVKITPHAHGAFRRGRATRERACAVTEEKDPQGRGDTCRFLAAGARRALWVRVRPGRLAEALPDFWKAVEGAEHIIIESNSLLEFLRPSVYLVVVDRGRSEFKASARQFLLRADAFVRVDASLEPRAWPPAEARALEAKPVFSVSAHDYASPELCRFVEERLATMSAEMIR